MSCLIRPMKENEYPLLEDFLYEAVFQKEGRKKAPRSIIRSPALYVYIEGFGTRKGDLCFCIEKDGNVVGAAWTRLMHGFGHVDDETPELAVSLYTTSRGRGLDTALIRRMLRELQARGYRRTSLSVHKANPAAALYIRLGYRVAREQGEDMVMEYVF